MKSKEYSMKVFLEMLPIILKLILGAVACFLVLFGIHWLAILIGICLGIIYYILPQKQ